MPRLACIALVLCVAVCTAPAPVPRGGSRGAPSDSAPPTPAPAAPRDPVAVAPEPRPFALLARFGAPADGKVLTAADRHADRFEFSADGRRMLASGGGTAQTWELPHGRPLASFPIISESSLSGPSRVALSPDGKWVIASSPFDMRTVVRDAQTGAVANERQQEDKLLAGFDGPQRVWVRNHRNGDLISFPLPDGPAGRSVTPPTPYSLPLSSPDGHWLVSSAGRDALRVRDGRVADPTWVELESYRDQPMGACGRVPPACAIPVRFSPDGRFLLTYWRGFHLWNLSDRAPRAVRLTEVRDHTRWHPDAAFSPDGRRLLAVVPDRADWARPGYVGSVRVWETATGSEAFRFDPPGGATGCALTPDGRRLVVAHPDATFSVWDYRALEARAVGTAGDAWERLASRDAKAGLAAVHSLVADPSAVALLRDRFRPADPARVARLISELGGDDYPTREAAERALAALGERAEAGLHRAAVGSESPEVRGRAARLLGPLTGSHGAARVRAGRAVEALERLGTPAAADLLAEWAKDGPARLAAEAGAAAARLAGGACTPRPDSEQ